MAFGITALVVVSDREQAYAQLRDSLKNYVKVDVRSSDLQYQINRSRTSAVVEKLKINRLSKWAAIRAGIGVMLPTGERVGSGVEEHACVLELDINTDGERPKEDVMSRDQLIGVVDEMIGFSQEILLQGDIP